MLKQYLKLNVYLSFKILCFASSLWPPNQTSQLIKNNEAVKHTNEIIFHFNILSAFLALEQMTNYFKREIHSLKLKSWFF